MGERIPRKEKNPGVTEGGRDGRDGREKKVDHRRRREIWWLDSSLGKTYLLYWFIRLFVRSYGCSKFLPCFSRVYEPVSVAVSMRTQVPVFPIKPRRVVSRYYPDRNLRFALRFRFLIIFQHTQRDEFRSSPALILQVAKMASTDYL